MERVIRQSFEVLLIYLFVGSNSSGERAAAIYSPDRFGPVEWSRSRTLSAAHPREPLSTYPVNRIDELLLWNVNVHPPHALYSRPLSVHLQNNEDTNEPDDRFSE
jgi:hypothetical protein